ncbi:MCE family protein [Nocardioides sp. BGMRC 2183]|nr:MCE family protein [Nocardioides sp. BGMRC 2183]
MARQLSELRRHRGAAIGVVLFTAFALLLTSMVAGTLSRSQSGESIELTAVFSDATGLRVGDDVRVAGVRVGRVTGTQLGDDADTGRAIVSFSVSAEQELRADTVATIDYLNLMGQRFVALERPPGRRTQDSGDDAVGVLADGDTIALESTRPALDLTALFNAFRPIFDLLQPEDINRLAGNIVAVLQGQGSTLRSLLTETADLTSGLVERDDALTTVVDNVTAVLESTDSHRTEISRLLRGLGRLSTGLAGDRQRIATSLDSLAELSATTAQLVEEAGPHLIEDVRLSRAWFRYLRDHEDELVAAGRGLPQQLKVYLRTLGYGSYLNVYVCSLDIALKGVEPSLDLGLGSNRNTERCR